MGQSLSSSIVTTASMETYHDKRLRIYYNSTLGVSDSSNDFDVTGGDWPSRSGSVSLSIPSGGGQQLIYDETVRFYKVYGSAYTVDFDAELTGVNFWGESQVISTSGDSEVPARAYATPSAPSTPVVSRVSDVEHSLVWTVNASTAARVQSQKVQRRYWNGSAWSGWATVANLTPDYTSNTAQAYTDGTTEANKLYQYRIVAVNSTAETASEASGRVYTTPAAPSAVSAAKDASGDVVLTITHATSIPDVDTVTESSTDAGSSWDPVETVDGKASTRTITGLTASAYLFRVAVVIDGASPTDAGDALQSGWAVSNSVSLEAPPNAPSGLAPNGAPRDATEPLVLSWVHNPVDTSPQSHFQIRHRLAGGAWTELVAQETADESFVLAGGYVNGDVVEWQVRTWGIHDDPSPYSATATIPLSARPTATISSPADAATLTGSQLTVAWTYFQAAASPQAQYRVQLLSGATVIETKTGVGTAASVVMDTTLADGAAYTVRVDVLSAAGLWSVADEISIDVSYLPPADVTVAPVFDRTTGVMELTLTPGTWDGTTTVEPISVTVHRSSDGGFTWYPVAADVALSAPDSRTVTDPIPPTRREVLYRATTKSATPSIAVADPVSITVDENKLAYLSYGPGFGTTLAFYGALELGSTAGREETVEYFAGREDESGMPAGVLISGQARSRDVWVAVTLLEDEGFATRDDFEAAALHGKVMCYRDPTGRRTFGKFTLQRTGQDYAPVTALAFTMTELGFRA